uniref:RECA_2 domain-containing protein n=1 Tax=Mesocestoides corti TaxID=53468 RepID=A0A5K3EHU8_MESCO
MIKRSTFSTLRLMKLNFRFDSLLSGGCLTGEITEVFGPSAVGKSQICHFIAAATSSHRLMQADALTTALVESKGSTVLYLDTKGDFCASRIRQLVCSLLRRRFGLANTNALERSTDHCLSRVWCRLVPGVQQLMDALVETRLCVATAALLEKTAKTVRLTNEEATFYSNLRLVIVDCIASPFVPFTSAFPNETTFQLRSVATELRRISADFHIAVLVTNNVRYGVDVPRPCLGEFWSSVPRVSIYMHSDEHRSPSRACVEVKRDLRYNCGLEAQSNSAYCVIDFRDSWEDLQH